MNTDNDGILSEAQVKALRPAEQIVTVMNRIYQRGMTTLSGGNLSIREPDGSVWMTPSGVDKGNLNPDDIIRVWPDGRVEGPHKPSSEGTMHLAIYQKRPDIQTIVHAHPPALMSYCISRSLPETRILPQPYQVCGKAGFAAYAIPGGQLLADYTAAPFAEGCDVVLMENHGVTAVGADLLTAYQRMETLETCARTLIQAGRVGEIRRLSDESLACLDTLPGALPETAIGERHPEEAARREELAAIVRRSCERGLMFATQGVASVRLDDRRYLITPTGKDRALLDAGSVVLVQDGQREKGKRPSRAARLHTAIYAAQPHVNAIMTGQPPHASVFVVTDAPFTARTNPECYALLRDMPRVPFDTLCHEPERIAATLRPGLPVLLIENYGLLATGDSLLQAFDLLEVAELNARALIDTRQVGPLSVIPDDEIEKLLRLVDGTA